MVPALFYQMEMETQTKTQTQTQTTPQTESGKGRGRGKATPIQPNPIHFISVMSVMSAARLAFLWERYYIVSQRIAAHSRAENR
jgi:hypothetical protein